MGSSDRRNTHDLWWRCLIACGRSPSEAKRLIRETNGTLLELFNAAIPQASDQRIETEGSVAIELIVDETDRQLEKLQARIALLTIAEQRAVLGHHIGHIPIDSLPLELLVSSADLESATAALLAGSGHTDIEALLSPLMDAPAPSYASARQHSLVLTFSAVCVVGLLVVLLLSARTSRPALEAEASPMLVPTTQTSTSVSPLVTSATKPAVSYVEPDREIEVFITERNTLVRLEPWTGRMIWESRPFIEPQLISVDPNTVTISSRGNRLIVSLTDGTLLPP